jgi:hypothetical protein
MSALEQMLLLDYNGRLTWMNREQDTPMGRKPDYPKQIAKLTQEVNRLKGLIAQEKKQHNSQEKKWQASLEKEKIYAYKAGCQDTLRAIEDEETAYMKFIKQAQAQFERMYHKKIRQGKKVA